MQRTTAICYHSCFQVEIINDEHLCHVFLFSALCNGKPHLWSLGHGKYKLHSQIQKIA